jgi:hypothetical protein
MKTCLTIAKKRDTNPFAAFGFYISMLKWIVHMIFYCKDKLDMELGLVMAMVSV